MPLNFHLMKVISQNKMNQNDHQTEEPVTPESRKRSTRQLHEWKKPKSILTA